MKKVQLKLLTCLLIVALVAGLAMTLASCGGSAGSDESATNASEETKGENTTETKPGETETETPTSNTIALADLLAQAKVNVDIETKGVVFAKTAQGVFVSDNNAAIFVKVQNTNAQFGDEIQIEGNYRLSAGQPMINATKVTVAATGKTPLAAAEQPLSAVAALKGDKENFAKYLKVQGILSKDESGHYVLTQDNAKVILTASKNMDNLLTKEIAVTVVTTAYDASNGWTLTCVIEDEIAETPFDLAGVAAEIFTAATPKDSVTGKLELMGSISAYPNVTFAWSVTSGDAIQVADNVATVSTVTADTTVTLKLVLSCDNQTQEKTFNVTVKAPRTLSLGQIAATNPAADETFYVTGTVVAASSNQSGDVESVVVFGDNTFYRVDLPDSTIRELKVGQEIKALVCYDQASLEEGKYEVTALRGISATKTSETVKPVDFSALPSTTLATEADFSSLFNAPYTEVKLYKIVNPFVSRSTSSNTNFFRFGATADQSKNGENGQYTGFYMRAENGINLNADILAANGIALPGDTTAIVFDGVTVYAFGAYRGKTTMQFAIPSAEAVELSKEATDAMIRKALPQTTYDASSAGEFDLPNLDFVTWTSDAPILSIQNGKAVYTKASADQVVHLTGSYTYGGKTESVVIDITLTGAPIPTLTISELTEDGVIPKLECVVVGIAPSHGGDVSKYSSYGLYVSDGETLAILSADKIKLCVSGYTYSIDEAVVRTGDKLLLTNVQFTKAGHSLTAAEGFTATITENGVDTSAYTYSASGVELMLSNIEELEAYVSGSKSKTLGIIKVEATAENPIYLAAQNGYLLALNFLTDENKDNTDGTAYRYDEKIMTLNILSFAAAFGNEWTIENTPVRVVGSGTYGSSASQQPKDNYAASTYAYTGTLYLVYEYQTKSSAPYYSFTGVLAGSHLEKLSADAE